MKKISVVLMSLIMSLCSVSAYADDASLQIHVTGTAKNNTYFLCVDGVGGCVSMFAADHGKVYPLTPGPVERIFMVSRTTLRDYFQPLPASCNITVNPNQTLIVKGRVESDARGNAHINHLECAVS